MTKKKKGKLIFQDNSWILELKTVVSKTVRRTHILLLIVYQKNDI